jgi:membrane protease YdiL (CAAX protease family)
MSGLVVVAGIVGQAVAWSLVRRGRLRFWPATAVTFAAVGIASLVVGDIACCGDVASGTAIAVGVASGALLFAATRVVVGLATRRPRLRDTVTGIYGRSTETSRAAELVISLLIAVPGEELFWRGLVLPELTDVTSVGIGALLTWVAAIGVIAEWASLPLLAGAIVGGALWTGLAMWSDGVMAPVASHLVWTGLMLMWPPAAARDMVPR